MKYILMILVGYFGILLSNAQTKDEREERITITELPDSIKTLVGKLPLTIKRLKFYKETDVNHKSYELKFKYNKKQYSIEFDTLGRVEDIEAALKHKQLTNSIKKNIEAYFTSNFKKYKLIKIQKQYVYHPSLSAHVFIKRVLKGTINTKVNYEIIAEVTDTSLRNLREFTFNQQGHFITFRTLVQPNYNHVLFEN